MEPGLLNEEIDQFFGRDRYLARHDVQDWSRELGSKHSTVAAAIDFLRRPIFHGTSRSRMFRKPGFDCAI
jgi:hypothetical protein